MLIIHFWYAIGKVLAEGHFTGRTVSGLEAQIKATSILKDIHGAPVESFVVKLSEAVGCFKTLRKMASFWSRVVSEVSEPTLIYTLGIPRSLQTRLCKVFQFLHLYCMLSYKFLGPLSNSLEMLICCTNQSLYDFVPT